MTELILYFCVYQSKRKKKRKIENLILISWISKKLKLRLLENLVQKKLFNYFKTISPYLIQTIHITKIFFSNLFNLKFWNYQEIKRIIAL